MDAKELRIGNLFNPAVPVAVEPWMLQPKAKVQFIPIPLTEEWLLKFGFEKRYSEWHSKICLEEDNSGEVYYSAGEGLRLSETIKYVHQLQNLYFALTGEELTLKSVVTKTK